MAAFLYFQFLPLPSTQLSTTHTEVTTVGRFLTEKKSVPLHSFPKNARGHTMCWRWAVGSWRLAVGGGWWRLVVVGGGWWLGMGG